jgi:hypothetical protein
MLLLAGEALSRSIPICLGRTIFAFSTKEAA